MSGHDSSLRAIFFALFANLGIALAKGAAAFYTGSGSMLAECIHSTADCANQLLLLLGLRRSRLPPDEEHPLGYGKVVYFWSFIVALLLFSVGGLFSIYEGLHKWQSSEAVENPWVALIVLGVSIVLESVSCYGALREARKLRGQRSFWSWLSQSRNAELVVVLGEDIAALLGLNLAFAFVLATMLSGDSRWDAAGSIAIGIVLLAVAIYLARHIKGLLIGRSADPEMRAMLEDHIARDPAIERVLKVLTVQFGPDVMLAAKLKLASDLSLAEAIDAINRLERELKAAFPAVRWSFIEPDMLD
ncbi:MAG: cation diffusion facilitator family transporter [Leptospirales bacterium]|nr:cation diffusion facilitator family transporter [Leptospirales bacterium]